MNVKALGNAGDDKPAINLVCPECQQWGSFLPLINTHFSYNHPQEGVLKIGLRSCPNTECRTIVYVVFKEKERTIVDSYPAILIDFDTTKIPETIVDTLKEAIVCHAHKAYKGGAMMVRRTLEELCHLHQAQGDNLAERLETLKNKVVLPERLFDGMKNLRLLGNDAAHIEARTYNDVGEEEVRLAIELTKEILKAVYQYDDLVTRLDALKQ